MTYLLIIFVIALALAPLSHFVPSKRQRKVARLREYAAVHGLFVEFRTLPGAKNSRQPPRAAPGGDIIYYGKRLPPRRGEPVTRVSWSACQEGWRSLDRRTPVPALLQQLPAGILVAGVSEASCGIYWQESGSQEDVEQIRQVLETWAEQLLH
ncbi:MAG: hypothetical protein DRR04_00495 [Gammaproteobacteria bacterium]|nr:MAG: hypothetical protein DRQ97_00970 [Gammaproteobacteria bacterium]RLA62335.1 MAG: hypothetical protein DRR04_00495 [Gammaproteobacteria bacterium]